MRAAPVALGLCCLLTTLPSPQDRTPEQRRVLAAMERLSAATAPGGPGPDGYAAVLADDFSRWSLDGTNLDGKESWVEGVREWWNDGWRVADRETRHLEIVVRGDHAFTRRIVTETYSGPDGERASSTAALAEVWVWDGERWLLLRVDVHARDDPPGPDER